VTEREFQQQIIDTARLLGWKCYHTFDSRRSEAGYPDLCLVRDRIVWLECKTEAGRVSPAQADWIAAINAAGGNALVVRPSQWDEIVRSLKAKPIPAVDEGVAA
jgi:hypothetical protein